jgi:hypothetical protein
VEEAIRSYIRGNGGSDDLDVEIVVATDEPVNRRRASRKEGGRKK